MSVEPDIMIKSKWGTASVIFCEYTVPETCSGTSFRPVGAALNVSFSFVQEGWQTFRFQYQRTVTDVHVFFSYDTSFLYQAQIICPTSPTAACDSRQCQSVSALCVCVCLGLFALGQAE